MTGERGLGWAAFHGQRRISVAEVHRYRIYQEVVNLMADDEKRKDLAKSRALARAAEAIRAREQREAAAAASSPTSRPATPLPPAQIIGAMPPFDPARMTPEEVAAWARAYTPPV